MDYEHPLISEFDPHDFEKYPYSTWSDTEELWRIGIRFQFNINKAVGQRMLNIVVDDIVSSR